MLDIYPGLYPLSKTLASCRTFDCIFPNDALSLIKVHCSMQSFDVRFLQGIRRSIIFNKNIFLIPKILHLNCKAIMLKIIVKKKNPEKKLLLLNANQRGYEIEIHVGFIKFSANLFLFACSVHVSSSAISSRQYLSKQNKIVSVKFHFCMTSIRKDSSRVHVIFERLIYSPSCNVFYINGHFTISY